MNQVPFTSPTARSLQFMAAIVCLLICGSYSAAIAQVEGVDSDYTVSAFFGIEPGQRTGQLFVNLKCAKDWVGYSTTTPTGGPLRTKIKIAGAESFEVTGEFIPLNDPHRKFDPLFKTEVHYHPGGETWVAPLRLAADTDPENLEINVTVRGQVCSTDETDARCTEVNEKLVAQYDGETEAPEYEMRFAPENGHAIVTGTVSPTTARPGDTVSVAINLKPTEGYKVYAFSEETQETLSLPTRITLQLSHGWAVSVPSPDQEPQQKIIMDEQQSFHAQPVTWTFDLTVPDNASPGKHSFTGLLGFQNCTDELCDLPAGASFHFDVIVGEATEGESKMKFTSEGSYRAAAALADRKAKEAKLIAK